MGTELSKQQERQGGDERVSSASGYHLPEYAAAIGNAGSTDFGSAESQEEAVRLKMVEWQNWFQKAEVLFVNGRLKACDEV